MVNKESRTFLSKAYKLTQSEALVVWETMLRPIVSKEKLVEVLWPNPDDEPDNWLECIRHFAGRANRKLWVHGWKIVGRHRGWILVRIDSPWPE